MDLHLTRHVEKSVLENKEHNLGIGISVGNKWFTPENTFKLIKWALEHTKEWVLIYVADIPHSVNLEVRNRISPERAERLAVRRGGEILHSVKEYISEHMSEEERARIYFATWGDIDEEVYVPTRDFIRKFYEEDEGFRNEVMDIVRGYVKNEDREFSEEDIKNLGMYIVDEFPEVMTKISIAGFNFDTYLYPYDGEVTRLVHKVQKGEKYPEIKEFFSKHADMRGFGVVR